jgi:hypothetical protein
MKTKILFILFVACCLLPVAVSAHILKTDGNIGLTIHVNPDDDPIVGSPASFFMEIVDKTAKFKPTDCTCTAQILNNGTQIYSAPLFSTAQANDVNAAPFFSYTFPETGIYTVAISGEPKTADAFQKFSINYDLRVSRTSAQSSDNNLWIYLSIALVAGAVIAVYLARKK